MAKENRADEQKGYWREHSAAWKRSGLSQQAYCQQENISYRHFVYQHNRLSKKEKSSAMHFVEARVSPISESLTTNSQTQGLQLTLPNGVRIGISKVDDIDLLQAVLSIAGALRC